MILLEITSNVGKEHFLDINRIVFLFILFSALAKPISNEVLPRKNLIGSNN